MITNNEKQGPKVKITLTDEQFDFINAHSSVIMSDNGENYFMPYWFRRINGNDFELLPLGKLPPEMTKEIEEMREQCNKASMFYKTKSDEGVRYGGLDSGHIIDPHDY